MSKIQEYNPPNHAIESFARCLLPTIQAYFESEQGRQEFEEWKASKMSEKGGRKQDS